MGHQTRHHASGRGARGRLAAHPNVTVEVADVTDLPYQAGTFEAVTSYLMLHHVIDWEPALAEAARVLQPGGSLLGYDLTDTRLARLVHQADRSPFRLIDPDELGDGLVAAGFDEVDVQVSLASHLMRFSARKSPQETEGA